MHFFEPLPTHALAVSLLGMTQAEGHRSFDLRLVIDCSLPIGASIVFPPEPAPLASPWVSPVLGWKGGESVALPYHRGGPVARGEERCPPKAEVVSSNLAGSANDRGLKAMF